MTTIAKDIGFNIEDLNLGAEPTHKVGVLFDEEGDDVSGFVIVGKNSNEYQTITSEIRSENIMRASKRKSTIDTATKEGADLLVRTAVTNEARIALAVATGWYGFNKGGQAMAYDVGIAEQMLKAKPQWIARILAALEVDANFMKSSPKG